MGLDRVVRKLNERHTTPFSFALFFTTEAESLGYQRPLDLLRKERVDRGSSSTRRALWRHRPLSVWHPQTMSNLQRPTLPPPKSYTSWLAYAVATMDTRSLQNDHDDGYQPQWQAKVTRAQMRVAAQAELRQLEALWSEMERAWAGTIETNEILSNPAAMKAIQRHKAGKTKFGRIRDI
jgi:hypothetical protein